MNNTRLCKSLQFDSYLLQIAIVEECQIIEFANHIIAQIQFDQLGHTLEEFLGQCFDIIPCQILK